MELTVDGKRCDLAEGAVQLKGTYDAALLLDPRRAGEGVRMKIRLPRSAENDAIFLGEAFNDRHHTAAVWHEGARMAEGRMVLEGWSDEEFAVELRASRPAWAVRAALAPLSELPLEYAGQLVPSAIAAGWRDEAGAVKFLPVRHDTYDEQNSGSDLQPVLRLFTTDDYHPFIRLDDALRALFAAAGYTVESRFMEQPLFRSLHFSGAYAAHDTAAAERRMGFRAVRLTTATATADGVGRVYATPYGAGCVVGNIVETATPLATDEEGRVRTEPYNNGNCFGYDGQKIVYRPRSTVRVGFEYRLRYTTEHRIATRDRLAGFDTLNLGTGGNIGFRIPNRYPDRREELAPARQYRAVVFGARAGQQFRLLYTRNGAAGSHWCDFEGRSAIVTTPAGGSVAAPRLMVTAGGAWSDWRGDWALYDGFVGERGETTVEVTLRTPSEVAGPTEPKYFNTIFFAGAEEGMRLTLHTACSLRPLFAAAPAYGAMLATGDICCMKGRQMELIEAAQQMFNLRICTDEARKCVVIEPDAEFWQEEREADWSGRTVEDEEVRWTELAASAQAGRIYGYRAGDGAAARAEQVDGLPFGSWRAVVPSAACVEGEERRTNALFSPTVSAAGGCTAAPSAVLMQVGDRDDPADEGGGFDTRIVSWRGMKPLPEGERWDDPTGGTEYPFAAFHHAGGAGEEPFTLCFEDRDGALGLHRYHDRAEALRGRRSVSLALRIEPHEYEGLFTPGGAGPDLRSVFRIMTDEGVVRATLERVERYDPERGVGRCTFVPLPHDRIG